MDRDPATLRVPCLTRLDEAEIREHLEQDRFFWLDLTDPSDTDVMQLRAFRVVS